MAWTKDERDSTNRAHLIAPEAGDYWHDMFAPCCVVLVVYPSTKTLLACGRTKAVTEDRFGEWTWNLDDTQTWTFDGFAEMLSYKYGDLKGKPCCDVAPRSHADIAEYWRENCQPVSIS